MNYKNLKQLLIVVLFLMPTVFLGQTDSTVKVPVSELRFFVAEHYKKLSLQQDTMLLNSKCIEYEKQVNLFKQEVKNQNDISSEKTNQITLLQKTISDTQKQLAEEQKRNSRVKKFLITGIVASFIGGAVAGLELHR